MVSHLLPSSLNSTDRTRPWYIPTKRLQASWKQSISWTTFGNRSETHFLHYRRYR